MEYPTSPFGAYSGYTPTSDYAYDTYAHDPVLAVDPSAFAFDAALGSVSPSSFLYNRHSNPPPYDEGLGLGLIPHPNSTSEPDSPMQSISPPLTSMSASELSNDSAALPPYREDSHTVTTGLTVHRRPLRQQAVVTSPLGNRKKGHSAAARRQKSHDDDFGSDDDDDLASHPVHTATHEPGKKREIVRKQRIESEQRRRDELRDGYRRLKDVLPVSNQKSSKVALLDRATTHIQQLETTQAHMIMKINELENEIARLRDVNEQLMLGAARARAPPPLVIGGHT